MQNVRDLADEREFETMEGSMHRVTTVLDDLVPLEPAVRGPALTRALLVPRTLKLYDLALAEPSEDDHEKWVHDVRVAARRFTEAMEMARPLLPPSDVDKVIRRARKIRRRLGRARELDVVFRDFTNLALQVGLPDFTLERIRDIVEGQRMEAASRADDALPDKKLEKQRAKALALAEVNQQPKLPFRDLAANHLARRAQEADDLLGSMEDASRSDDHHNLRIRFKRMRYAVELADELLALESDPKDILQHAKRLQDALGILNDGHDLVDFMRRPEVMQILGRFEQPLEDEARRIVRRRYKTAHHLVADRGARIVGEVRRAAGLIGRFQPAVS